MTKFTQFLSLFFSVLNFSFFIHHIKLTFHINPGRCFLMNVPSYRWEKGPCPRYREIDIRETNNYGVWTVKWAAVTQEVEHVWWLVIWPPDLPGVHVIYGTEHQTFLLLSMFICLMNLISSWWHTVHFCRIITASTYQ